MCHYMSCVIICPMSLLVLTVDIIFQLWEDREGRKNMSKNNAKGLTYLRKKLRLFNRSFETALAEFREVCIP